MSSSIEIMASNAAKAAMELSLLDGAVKNKILEIFKVTLKQNADEVLNANKIDIEKALKSGMLPHMIDRLSLNEDRIDELINSVEQVIKLPDPTGALEDKRVMDNGLQVARLRVPLGLIAFICEARPGALVEASILCIKSGNGLIVKCGKEMFNTAVALQKVFAAALQESSVAVEAITVLPAIGREELRELLTLSETIDLVIPRGGEGLIRFVSENSRIPVLKHYKGVCHLYVDKSADLNQALEILVNGKTQRPSVCNSLEALLVHQDIAAPFLAMVHERLSGQVKLKADPLAKAHLPGAEDSQDNDWGREFLDLILAVKVVGSFDEAVSHINKYGSRHTEVIVTADAELGRKFQQAVDASCVMVNASSRLNDGGSLGLGAEIGISTTKLHAYGVMGLQELTTTKFVVTGAGHLR